MTPCNGVVFFGRQTDESAARGRFSGVDANDLGKKGISVLGTPGRNPLMCRRISVCWSILGVGTRLRATLVWNCWEASFGRMNSGQRKVDFFGSRSTAVFRNFSFGWGESGPRSAGLFGGWSDSYRGLILRNRRSICTEPRSASRSVVSLLRKR